MSAVVSAAAFQRLLDRARITERELVDMRCTAGGLVVMLARPNGSGGAAQARNHAEGWRYVAYMRDELDHPKPDQRGPAADVSGEERA